MIVNFSPFRALTLQCILHMGVAILECGRCVVDNVSGHGLQVMVRMV